MNLVETHGWRKRWSEVADFISSVPFCIARNPEEITDNEVRNYPNEISLPTGFCSSNGTYSHAELKAAIENNLQGKVASFDEHYRNEQQRILEEIVNNKSSFPPEENGKYSLHQRWLFLQTNVLRLLLPKHANFVREQRSKSEAIRIECFKSIFIQILAIFLEYYVQNKGGKPSDVGDLYQLSYIPYVSMAIIDKERHDLIPRMNRTNLFPRNLSAYNLAQFRGIIQTRA